MDGHGAQRLAETLNHPTSGTGAGGRHALTHIPQWGVNASIPSTGQFAPNWPSGVVAGRGKPASGPTQGEPLCFGKKNILCWKQCLLGGSSWSVCLRETPRALLFVFVRGPAVKPGWTEKGSKMDKMVKILWGFLGASPPNFG